MPSTSITARIDASAKKRLDSLAKSTRRSRAYLAGAAIEEFLAVNEWQVAGVKAALLQADTGEVVAHDEVMAWIRSWDTANELPPPSPKAR